MKWFEGSIPEAIQLAKSQRSLFIVFVTGDDEVSQETTKVWDNESVAQLSVASSSVTLKLDAKSQLGIQFAQIYPVMVIPSVFFIAPETGLPLEVTMGQFTPTQLMEKFSKALQMQQSSASDSFPSASRTSPSSSRTELTASSSSGSGATGDEMNPGTDRERKKGDEDQSQEDCNPEETLEERKERLLRKMEKRRDEKEKEAEEKERKAEIDRRKLGQETQKFRQWKAEMERKEFENSYKKEKEEQKRALEKIRADLERDRQERAMKYRQEKEQNEEAAQRAKTAKLVAEAKRLETENAMKRESSRIQFRLPDGSSITQVFPSTETLSTAQNFIQERLNNKPVTLSTTFPKRTFVEADMTQTLLDLELVPSSVLIVLLKGSEGSGRVVTPDTTGTSFLWMILAPLITLWNFIYGFLFPPSVPLRHGNQNVERPRSPQTGSMKTDQSGSIQQQPSSQGLRSRKVGNINRLTADDEDDESATWNGNSTQQM